MPIGRLDAYRLEMPIAEGGMGRVWAATLDGQEVAIKVGLDRRHAAAVHREARALAPLDHPNIVRLLDHGVVDAAHAATLDTEPGAPWMAMERALGSLQWQQLDWSGVAVLVRQLLDGLAHAHARGVIHRDLKPGNVLRFGPQTWKIADFGIAHATSRTGSGQIEPSQGTPWYMAPEQLEGRWRDYGPWTDLYALGAMLRDLVATVSVPDGLRPWLERLLQVDPGRRFRRAADAAHAFPRLTANLAVPEGPDLHATTLSPGLVMTLGTPAGRPPPVPLAVGPAPRAPLRESWQEVPSVPRSARLSLLDLRPAPFTGRLEQRQLLWNLLVQAANHDQARAVQLVGPAGRGKTRLARWFAERAHEVGGAEVISVSLSDGGDLARIARTALGTRGLDDQDTTSRTRALVADRWDADVLCSLQGVTSERADPRAALAAVARLVTAGPRPLVLVLDDVGEQPDAVRLARTLLAQDGAAVVVLTGRSEQAGLPVQAVEGLAEAALAELLRAWVPLEASLHTRLVRASAGSPRYAARVVRGWVDLELLVLTQRGLELKPGVELTLPFDVAESWRVDLAKLGTEDELRALEAAAVLGFQVDPQRWRTLCERVGLSWMPGLEGRFADAGLITLEREGLPWRFAQPELRDVLLDRAGDGGRRAALHRHARELEPDPARRWWHEREAGDPEAALESVSQASVYLAVQARYRELLSLTAHREALLDAIDAPADDLRRADALLRRVNALQFLGRSDGAVAAARQALAIAEPLQATRRLAQLYDHLSALGQQRNDPELVAYAGRSVPLHLALGDVDSALHARIEEGGRLQMTGHTDQAVAHYRTLIQELDPRVGARTESALRMSAGNAMLQVGEVQDAARELHAGLALCVENKLERYGAYAQNALAKLALDAGQLDEAERRFSAALTVNQRLGLRATSAHNELGLAGVAHERGNLAEAEQRYLRSVGLMDRFDQGWSWVPRAGLAAMLVESGRFEEALDLLGPAISQKRADGQASFLAVLLATVLACEQDLEAWDRQLAEIRADTSVLTRTACRCLAVAAERMVDQQDHGRAAELVALASGPLERIGDLEGLRRLRRVADRVGDRA